MRLTNEELAAALYRAYAKHRSEEEGETLPAWLDLDCKRKARFMAVALEARSLGLRGLLPRMRRKAQ